MLQTILITALSAQLTYLKPALTTTPPMSQVENTRVLTDKDFVNVVVDQDYKTYTLHVKKVGEVIQLPQLKKDFEKNASLLQPTTDVSSSADVITVVSTVTPTIEPTETPVPTMMPTPAVTDTVPTVAYNASGISDTALDALGSCEAGNNPARNSGNGYYGAFQFSYGTWKSMNTGYERADLAPMEVQKAAVRQLLNRSSIYNQFPGCARKLHGEGLI